MSFFAFILSTVFQPLRVGLVPGQDVGANAYFLCLFSIAFLGTKNPGQLRDARGFIR